MEESQLKQEMDNASGSQTKKRGTAVMSIKKVAVEKDHNEGKYKNTILQFINLEDKNFKKNKIQHMFECWRNYRLDKKRHL